jgi:hypothetical protein
MATVPANDERPPMAEPGRRRSGASTGGVAESPTQGVEDALQRSTERGLDEPLGTSTGNAAGGAGGPRIDLGGTNEPGAGPGTTPPGSDAVPRSGGSGNTAPQETTARPASGSPSSARERAVEPHHPEEPPDEGAVESFGRAIGEVVTGSDEEDIDPRRPTR